MTVVIPTRGLSERVRSLRRAIESAAGQGGVRAIPLVVVNGEQRCVEVERALRADHGVRVIVREEGGLPEALRAGRAAVDTPFFCALDDDDLLLPGALALRVRTLTSHPESAVVVTNGYRRDASGDALLVPPGLDVGADPLRALLRRNWLLPGSWLARTEEVGADLFDAMARHLECTYLAVRFATSFRVRWVSTPTVVYTVGSPHAATRSREYVVGQVEALRRILELPLPPDVHWALRVRVADAYHTAASRDWRDGRLRDAWRWHLASLREPDGWRYLSFTRHLIHSMLRPPT